MNKKNIFLGTLFAISGMQIVLSAEPQEQSPKRFNKLCKTYATSLISGGTLGSITGLLSIHTLAKSITFADYIMKKHNHNNAFHEAVQIRSFFTFGVIVPILVLISEYKLRSTLVNYINHNFEENEIKHSKNLIRETAWIASWIAFLSYINFNE